MKAPSVLCIGGATQDVFIRSKALEEHHDEQSADGIAACFLMGSKMSIDELTFSTGGGATNAAVTFNRFGLRASCLSRVGEDPTADQIVDDLVENNVDVHFMQYDKKEKTGYSVILLSGTGHRAIFTHRGAGQKINSTEFPWHHWSKKIGSGRVSDWIYLTSLGGDMKALNDIFEHAQKTKTPIAWNPGNQELAKGFKILKPFIEKTAILSLNSEEAQLLGGMSALGHLPTHAFLMTEGGKGATVRCGKQTLRAPALKAKRVNTTGAGDAFGSAFVATWIKTSEPRTALAAAMLNATGVITHMGAKAGILKKYPSDKELKRVQIK
ncbi:MAG: carbohydrate kinase family protein [Candidatus Uhrbacteria bacterium]